MKFIVYFLLFAHITIAQNPTTATDVGTWNIWNVKINLHKKWSVFGETQLRSLGFYQQFHYYEYKTGVNFHLNKHFSLAVGTGNYHTYSEGGNFLLPKKNEEFRTWLQVYMHQYLDIIKFEHRYRVEQRWLLQEYRNRFRYRINMLIPLNSKKIATKTIYFTAWNEIFMSNQPAFFERNRFFVGLGYEATPYFAFQAGYLHQLDYKVTTTEKSFFQISCLVELKRKLGKEEEMPVAE